MDIQPPLCRAFAIVSYQQIIQSARHLKVGSIHQRHGCCMCIIRRIHWRSFQVVYCAAVCCDVGVLGNEAQQDQATV